MSVQRSEGSLSRHPSKIHIDPSIFVFRMTHSIGKARREDSRMLCNHATIHPLGEPRERGPRLPVSWRSPGPRGLTTSEMIQSETVPLPHSGVRSKRRCNSFANGQRDDPAIRNTCIHSSTVMTHYSTRANPTWERKGKKDRKRSGTNRFPRSPR